jgi:D-glycero-alpha-D-manno-heptose-7-phosphate kinase
MRISLAGGGTELSPYVDNNGGCVLSLAIGVYAYAQLTNDRILSKNIRVKSQETSEELVFGDLSSINLQECPKNLRLAIATLKYFHEIKGLDIGNGFTLTVGSEAPTGSGLGASSVLTVAIVNVLQNWFGLNWTKVKIADASYFIERSLLNLKGGLQDHYPAVYGGVNLIEFDQQRKASVSPIELSQNDIGFLESSLLLLYTGVSRESSKIIEEQTNSNKMTEPDTVEIFHQLKSMVGKMKNALLNQDTQEMGKLLSASWELKKSTSTLISNERIDHLFEFVMSAGAYGGKISGAGGGGFMIFIVPADKKIEISRKVSKEDLVIFPTHISIFGAQIFKSKKDNLHTRF